MLDRLKRRLCAEQFEPGPLSIVVNPVYFARRGLFSHIVDLASRRGLLQDDSLVAQKKETP